MTCNATHRTGVRPISGERYILLPDINCISKNVTVAEQLAYAFKTETSVGVEAYLFVPALERLHWRQST